MIKMTQTKQETLEEMKRNSWFAIISEVRQSILKIAKTSIREPKRISVGLFWNFVRNEYSTSNITGITTQGIHINLEDLALSDEELYEQFKIKSNEKEKKRNLFILGYNSYSNQMKQTITRQYLQSSVINIADIEDLTERTRAITTLTWLNNKKFQPEREYIIDQLLTNKIEFAEIPAAFHSKLICRLSQGEIYHYIKNNVVTEEDFEHFHFIIKYYQGVSNRIFNNLLVDVAKQVNNSAVTH